MAVNVPSSSSSSSGGAPRQPRLCGAAPGWGGLSSSGLSPLQPLSVPDPRWAGSANTGGERMRAGADPGGGHAEIYTGAFSRHRQPGAPASILLRPGHPSPSRCPLLLLEQGRRRSAGVLGRQLPQLSALTCRAVPAWHAPVTERQGWDLPCWLWVIPPPHLGGSSSPPSHIAMSISMGGSAPPQRFLGKAPRAGAGFGCCLQGRGIRAREKTCNVLSLIRLPGLLLRGAKCLL